MLGNSTPASDVLEDLESVSIMLMMLAAAARPLAMAARFGAAWPKALQRNVVCF